VSIPPDDQFGPSRARERAAAVIARSDVLIIHHLQIHRVGAVTVRIGLVTHLLPLSAST
jgi:hypothetical protein